MDNLRTLCQKILNVSPVTSHIIFIDNNEPAIEAIKDVWDTFTSATSNADIWSTVVVCALPIYSRSKIKRTPIASVKQFDWFHLTLTSTNAKDVSYGLLTLAIGTLDAILPSNIRFVMITRNEFATEVSSNLLKCGRETILINCHTSVIKIVLERTLRGMNVEMPTDFDSISDEALMELYHTHWTETDKNFCLRSKIDPSLFSKWIKGGQKSPMCRNAVINYFDGESDLKSGISKRLESEEGIDDFEDIHQMQDIYQIEDFLNKD